MAKQASKSNLELALSLSFSILAFYSSKLLKSHDKLNYNNWIEGYDGWNYVAMYTHMSLLDLSINFLFMLEKLVLANFTCSSTLKGDVDTVVNHA